MAARLSRRTFLAGVAATGVALAGIGAWEFQQHYVLVRPSARRQWRPLYTTTLADVPGALALPPDTKLNQYGGVYSDPQRATGFFYTSQINGRWWLVDPLGGLFFLKAVSSVRAERTPRAEAAYAQRYGTRANWADAASQTLYENGFNSTGAWSDLKNLRGSTPELSYTQIWSFMANYAIERAGGAEDRKLIYPNQCIPVFDTAFRSACNTAAQALAATRDDPYLIGHFSDNELPFPADALDRYLELDETDSGHQAAQQWLVAQGITKAQITAKHQAVFQQYLVSYYYAIVAEAIKRNDPNHLFLGSRFHDEDKITAGVFAGAAAYTDVFSVNYYDEWTPDPAKLAKWTEWSNRPFIVTEFYVKGDDVGLANTTGAGWIVPTQADRGRFFQHFTLGLMRARGCVGITWFRYQDNDPTAPAPDPSNADANKGIVDITFAPYQILLKAMQQLNQRSYGLISYFDSQS